MSQFFVILVCRNDTALINDKSVAILFGTSSLQKFPSLPGVSIAKERLYLCLTLL